MQLGKYKCKQLKAVRKRIAEENDIPLEQKECTYQGPCKGTCPHCEAEVRYLERALASRIKWGKVATAAGLSLGLAACGGGQLEGEMPMLTIDSSSPVDSLTDSPRDTLPTGTQHAGPDVIDVLEEGELVVCGDVIELPPPPPEDSLMVLGKMEIIEEGKVISHPAEEGGIEENDDEKIYTVVEVDPEFPGGMDSLHAWIQHNLRYPQQALDNGISGRVYVTFVVEKDGSLSNPRILRDIGGGCGNEAIRLVKSMPRWNPGRQRGEPIRVQFNLPINFSLK